MKKTIVTVMAMLLMLLCISGTAESVIRVYPWHISEISNGALFDLDGDLNEDRFGIIMNADEYGDGSFTVSVNDQSFIQENCYYLKGKAYVMFIGWPSYDDGNPAYYAALIMIPELGMSDDPYSYCYLYTNSKLYSLGGIPATPDNMTVDPGTGVITTQVRAGMIGTWNRPADYIISEVYHWGDESFESFYSLTEVPRDLYPCGMIVTLNRQLPLLSDRFDTGYSSMMTPSDNPRIVITATDDNRWIYVSSIDDRIHGWVKMRLAEEYGTLISVGGIDMNVNDVFGDIFYAD